MQPEHRRRHNRLPVHGIWGTLRNPRDVRTLNVSRSGLAFETPTEVSVGENYFLDLWYGENQVSLEIEVRWRRDAERQQKHGEAAYLAGARFIDVLAGAQDIWGGIELATA